MVRIPRAPDDRPGYVIGVGLDQAAWAVQSMLPEPRVVEERIMDLVDEDARAAGEAAMACADYWGAIAQMYQHDAGEPMDGPLVVEVRMCPPWPRRAHATCCSNGLTSSRPWPAGRP